MASMVTPLPLSGQLWQEGMIKLSSQHACLILGFINVVHVLGKLNKK
jgi:hypothetical protein